jgi:hypothetical protein
MVRNNNRPRAGIQGLVLSSTRRPIEHHRVNRQDNETLSGQGSTEIAKHTIAFDNGLAILTVALFVRITGIYWIISNLGYRVQTVTAGCRPARNSKTGVECVRCAQRGEWN